MRFELDNIFGIHQQALLVRSKRAELLASNMANADTPNYKSRDIDFQKILKDTYHNNRASELIRTNPKHLSSGERIYNTTIEVMYRTPVQDSLDGNTVDTQIEKSHFINNAIQYQASLRFLGGKIKSILTALKGE